MRGCLDKLRADHEIVVLACRAQHARRKPLAKFKGKSSSDNWTRGDNGEIAVPENAAGHTHVSWLLRNRSDVSLRNLGAHRAVRVACEVKACVFHLVLPPSHMEPPIRKASLHNRPRRATRHMLSAKSPWSGWVGFRNARKIKRKSSSHARAACQAQRRKRQCEPQGSTRVQKR